MQYLKYLEKYEEEGNNVFFYLKDYPSSKMIGEKIVRELYISLFHDEMLQLNRVHKIDALKFLVQKKQEFFCLNCNEPIFFHDLSISSCNRCNWRNDLDDSPAADIDPIAVKLKTFDDFSCQIAYPLLDKQLLNALPARLKEAVETFFQAPEDFTKAMYQNIYHNIYKKDLSKIIQKLNELKARKEFISFFHDTTFLKS